MIGTITAPRGQRVGGLLYYLFGPGRRQEQTGPHIVAGRRHPAELDHLSGHPRCTALSAVRSLFVFAKKQSLIFANPARRLKADLPAASLLPIEDDEIRAVERAVSGPARRVMVALAAVHAARWVAIRVLTWPTSTCPTGGSRSRATPSGSATSAARPCGPGLTTGAPHGRTPLTVTSWSRGRQRPASIRSAGASASGTWSATASASSAFAATASSTRRSPPGPTRCTRRSCPGSPRRPPARTRSSPATSSQAIPITTQESASDQPAQRRAARRGRGEYQGVRKIRAGSSAKAVDRDGPALRADATPGRRYLTE